MNKDKILELDILLYSACASSLQPLVELSKQCCTNEDMEEMLTTITEMGTQAQRLRNQLQKTKRASHTIRKRLHNQ